jgi:hypothetical protein
MQNFESLGSVHVCKLGIALIMPEGAQDPPAGFRARTSIHQSRGSLRPTDS